MSPSSVAEQVEAIAGLARRVETPCGDGDMVWHVWGEGADKPPLVLLHGGSGAWNHWIRQIPVFSPRYEVWAPDLPGLGDSDMPAEPLTPQSCGEAVADGMFRLFTSRRRPHVVAFSFGAHVGVHAAELCGALLRSFTIVGAAALGLPHPKRDIAKEHVRMTAAERADVHRRNLALIMLRHAASIDDLAVHLQTINIARARLRSRTFAPTDGIARALPNVVAPVAAIWGALDQLAIPDVESRHRVLRGIKPDLLWRTVEDAGHWAMYERTEAFNAALHATLEDFEQGRS